MDQDIMEQALLVLFTGVRDTGCVPGHARERGQSMDEAGLFFLLEPLEMFWMLCGLMSKCVKQKLSSIW